MEDTAKAKKGFHDLEVGVFHFARENVGGRGSHAVVLFGVVKGLQNFVVPLKVSKKRFPSSLQRAMDVRASTI